MARNAGGSIVQFEPNRCQRCCKGFCKELLFLLLLLSIGGGIGLGVFLRDIHHFSQTNKNAQYLHYLYFPAELITRIISFVTLPLSVTSVIAGGAALSTKLGLKVVLCLLCYYLSTSILGVLVGLGFVYGIRPGKSMVKIGESGAPGKIDIDFVTSFLDILRNLFPDDMIKATFQTIRSDIINITHYGNTTLEINLVPREGINILGLTVFSVLFGLAISRTEHRGRPLKDVLEGTYFSLLKYASKVLWLYPVFSIFSLAHRVITSDNPTRYPQGILIFLLTAILALFAHAFLLLPGLCILFSRRNPYKILWRCRVALVTAFITNHSAMTLPATLKSMGRSGVNIHVSRYTIPIGAALNMDGLAIYQIICVVFIATLNNVIFSPVHIIVIGLTVVCLSLRVTPISSNIIRYTLLLQVAQLPANDLQLLLSLDWIVERFRTVVNVWGDCVGAAVVGRLTKHHVPIRNVDFQENPYEEGSYTIEGDDCDEVCAFQHPVHPEPSFNPILWRRKGHRHNKDWTVKLINEHGDNVVVSKV